MSKVTNVRFFLCGICAIFWSCRDLYEVNHLIYLDYPIETTLKSSLVQSYCNTLIHKHGYNVPSKWVNQNKLVELDSISHTKIYFRSNPEEMYLISFGGMIVLNDVYNPQIREGQWVARRELMPKEQELRVIKRFKTEILNKIEVLAQKDGVSDSVIYKR